jgi:hypothetical protein
MTKMEDLDLFAAFEDSIDNAIHMRLAAMKEMPKAPILRRHRTPDRIILQSEDRAL